MARTKKASRDPQVESIDILEEASIKQDTPVEESPEVEKIADQPDFIEADLKEFEEAPIIEATKEPVKESLPQKSGVVILVTRDGCIVKNSRSGDNERLYGMQYKTLNVGETILY